jgi:dimethylaniline monooxygenase (N-oxide forming)
MESYAHHFDLHKDIVFGASVTRAVRNEDDTQWRLEMLVDGEQRAEEFDKVVFCHGYQTTPKMPKYDGQELFKGRLMHGQQFRT